MKNMTKIGKVELTVFEVKMVNAMRNNEYNDAIESPTWTFTAIDNSGIPAKQARGVISSLVQKGLVIAEVGDKKNGDEDTIGFTEAGKKLFNKANGADCAWGGKKLLKEIEEAPAAKKTPAPKKEVQPEVVEAEEVEAVEVKKEYVAIFRKERTGSLQVEVKHETKRKIKDTLRGNGFRVVKVLTKSQVEEILKDALHPLHPMILELRGNGLV